MQALQQTQDRPRPREESAWVPLALLIIPAVTFLIFVISTFSDLSASRGTLPSAPQPAWLHFCMTHQRLLARMFAAGMLCSGLNSFATLVWLRREEPRQQVHRAEGITPTALYVGGAYLLLALLMAAACLCKVFQGPRSLTHSPVLDGPVAEGILVTGLFILIISLMVLVVVTSISTIIELFTRLRRPKPIS